MSWRWSQNKQRYDYLSLVFKTGTGRAVCSSQFHKSVTETYAVLYAVNS